MSFHTQVALLSHFRRIESTGFSMEKEWAIHAKAIEDEQEMLGADGLVLATTRLTHYSNRRWPKLEAEIAKRKSDLSYYYTTLSSSHQPACREAHEWAMNLLGYKS